MAGGFQDGPFIAVGIDFGTCYTSAAWCFSESPDDIEVIKWGTRFHRLPSKISYYSDGTIKWGFNCQEKHIRYFKLLLASNKASESSEDAVVSDVKKSLDAVGKSPISVAADFLECVLKYIFDGNKIPIKGRDVRIAFTVPSSWNSKARFRLEVAVEKALHLSGTTTMDASFQVLSQPIAEIAASFQEKDIATKYKIGDAILVCNAGGGYVEVCSYLVESFDPMLQLSELTFSHSLHGAVYLGQNFEDFARTHIGLVRYKSLSFETKQRLMKEWQLYVRYSAPPRRPQTHYLELLEHPFPGSGFVALDRDGFTTLDISSTSIADIFDGLISKIFDAIKDNLIFLEASQSEAPKALLLIGEFAENGYLQDSLEEAFPELQILGSWTGCTSGCRGAALLSAQSKQQDVVRPESPSYRFGLKHPVDGWRDATPSNYSKDSEYPLLVKTSPKMKWFDPGSSVLMYRHVSNSKVIEDFEEIIYYREEEALAVSLGIVDEPVKLCSLKAKFDSKIWDKIYKDRADDGTTSAIVVYTLNLQMSDGTLTCSISLEDEDEKPMTVECFVSPEHLMKMFEEDSSPKMEKQKDPDEPGSEGESSNSKATKSTNNEVMEKSTGYDADTSQAYDGIATSSENPGNNDVSIEIKATTSDAGEGNQGSDGGSLARDADRSFKLGLDAPNIQKAHYITEYKATLKGFPSAPFANALQNEDIHVIADNSYPGKTILRDIDSSTLNTNTIAKIEHRADEGTLENTNAQLALTSLQSEHNELLAALSRSQRRARVLEKKYQVSDKLIISLTEENHSLDSQVSELGKQIDELERSRDEYKQAAVQGGVQYVEIIKKANQLRDRVELSRISPTILLLRLVSHIAFIPHEHIRGCWLCRRMTSSWVNRAKLRLEKYTKQPWDWWPLAQPHDMPDSTMIVVAWSCNCGQETTFTMTQDSIKEELEKATKLESRHGTPRKHPQTPPSANTTPQAASPSSPPVSTLRSGISSGVHNPGLTAMPPIQAITNPSPPVQPLAQQPSSVNMPTREYVLLGVKRGYELDLKNIDIQACPDDSHFFQTLKNTYNTQRGLFRRIFDISQYHHCDFVEFEKICYGKVIRRRNGYPHDVSGYTRLYKYRPKAKDPQWRDPPIWPDEFYQRYYGCSNCMKLGMSYFHACSHFCPATIARMERIPKRTVPLELNSQGEEPAWGLQAIEYISGIRVIVYHALMLIGPFVFWGLWIWYWGHAGDLQNATVPLACMIPLLSMFWGLMKG